MLHLNKYEALLSEADEKGIKVKELDLKSSDGRLKGNKIGIRKDLSTAMDKACVLAEELGHHHTSVGNILDLDISSNRKQERQARLWGYNKMIGLTGIIKAYQYGCRNLHDMAELLEVPERYLVEAIECYRDKYGVFVSVDNYTIYFIPHLAVMEMI